MTPKHREAERLLHVLWTKAVGTSGYVKDEWVDLQAAIGQLARADQRLGERRGG